MYVIVTYDAGEKRNAKLLKLCRRYLVHVQKSVFEGEISDSKLSSLQRAIERIIDVNVDQVAIYKYPEKSRYDKIVIGQCIQEEDNII